MNARTDFFIYIAGVSGAAGGVTSAGGVASFALAIMASFIASGVMVSAIFLTSSF